MARIIDLLLRKYLAPPSPTSVWAVEPTAIQITWGELPSGMVRARAGGNEWSSHHPGGPGAIELYGLRPATTYDIELTVDGAGHHHTKQIVQARTLDDPGGQELFRFATISDLHLGTGHFGFLKTMREAHEPPELFSIRCARSAMAAAQAWGAQLLVIKGDAVHHRLESHYQILADLVDEFDNMEMLLLPGNHDVDLKSEVPLPISVGRRGLAFETEPCARRFPGLRLITTDTSVPGKGSGSILSTQDAVLDLAASAEQGEGVVMACHHQFQPYRLATHWPPGISGEEANPFLAKLGSTAPGGFVTSGHTHRCRAYERHSLQLTEVSSTSDFPGSWAGYIVSEGGITQTVRRIVTPAEMDWLEHTQGALWGLWGKWSPGSIKHRCLSHSWASGS